MPDIPRGSLVIVEGRAPIWRYGMALHLLHGSPAAAIAFYDPRLGAVIVASHNQKWQVGQVVDVTLPAKAISQAHPNRYIFSSGDYDMLLSKAELNASMHNLAKRYAEKAAEILGDQLISIALYGSVARGQAGPTSDIDLFVVSQEAPSGMLARRRLLDPVHESLAPELDGLWRQGIYADFIEVIRTAAEARQFHPLYLDMSREAILLYDRDRFMEKMLDAVRKQLERGGAERKVMGKFWYWDLSGFSFPAEVVDQ